MIRRPRKTREQVLQWLREHDLYRKVARRLPFPITEYPTDVSRLDEYFYGLFDWKTSPEGFDYWNNINKQFLDWYNETTV